MFTFDGAVPKALLSAGNKTILEEIIDSYSDVVDVVHIMCTEEQAKMCKAILDYNKCSKDVRFDIFYEPTESAYHALHVFNEHVNEDVDGYFVNWCDVYPQKIKSIPETSVIYTDKQFRHRNLGFEEPNGMKHVYSTVNNIGNVPGIFYVTKEDFETACSVWPIEREVKDFDKQLVKYGPEFVELDGIIDTGDYVKYTKYMSSKSNIARYFNEIEIGDEEVTKRPITKKGEDLHDIELSFYRKYGSDIKSLCRLLKYDRANKTMHLERIKGKTCQAYVDSQRVQNKALLVNKMLKAFEEAITEFHKLEVPEHRRPSRQEEFESAQYEFIEQIYNRVNPCLHMIERVIEVNDIKSIDGMPITRDFEELVAMVRSWFIENEENFEFGICHGDPNTDNSMYTTDGVIKFIDPRGYFGKLKHLGWSCKQYDFAKFAYGFSGYSRFTNADYIAIRIVNGDVKTYTGSKEIEGITDTSIFDMDIDNMTRFLIGIIWVKLCAYIINSPTKSILAYLYGNALITKLFNESK